MQVRRDNLEDKGSKFRAFAITGRRMVWVVNRFEATLVWDCGSEQDSHA